MQNQSCISIPSSKGGNKLRAPVKTCLDDQGQSIAEYAIMCGIILVLVLGVLRLMETNALALLVQIAKAIG